MLEWTPNQNDINHYVDKLEQQFKKFDRVDDTKKALTEHIYSAATTLEDKGLWLEAIKLACQ